MRRSWRRSNSPPPQLDSLAKQLIDIAVSAQGLEVRALKDQLRDQGFGTILNQMERALSHGGDWFARSDASAEDAEIGWHHTLARQRKAVALDRELKAAEHDFVGDPGEGNAARLAAARAACEVFDGNESTIEGYGRSRDLEVAPGSFDEWLERNKHRLP